MCKSELYKFDSSGPGPVAVEPPNAVRWPGGRCCRIVCSCNYIHDTYAGSFARVLQVLRVVVAIVWSLSKPNAPSPLNRC